jgi:hypothetical protein
MEKWEKTKRYTSAHLIGGRNLSLMVMFFYFKFFKACMEQNMPVMAYTHLGMDGAE